MVLTMQRKRNLRYTRPSSTELLAIHCIRRFDTAYFMSISMKQSRLTFESGTNQLAMLIHLNPKVNGYKVAIKTSTIALCPS